MYTLKGQNGKRFIAEFDINKLVELGVNKNIFLGVVKQLEKSFDFHPDAVEDVMKAIELLGWDEDETFKELGWL